MNEHQTRTDAQFVTLGIDREVFAVPVETVVEILDMREIFRVPDAPPHLAGLIDVRGRSVPVIDLRVKLGLPPAAPTETTRIMVLEVPMAGRQLVLGLVADRVFEVARSTTAAWSRRPTSAPDGAPTTSAASGVAARASSSFSTSAGFSRPTNQHSSAPPMARPRPVWPSSRRTNGLLETRRSPAPPPDNRSTPTMRPTINSIRSAAVTVPPAIRI